jgi:hypothetical protein
VPRPVPIRELTAVYFIRYVAAEVRCREVKDKAGGTTEIHAVVLDTTPNPSTKDITRLQLDELDGVIITVNDGRQVRIGSASIASVTFKAT